MLKRTFWTHKKTGEEYLREVLRDAMILLAATYNRNGDQFPKKPKKEIVILDIHDKKASVKLMADEWIDYMHIVQLNGKWQIVNVLWQFNDSKDHK
ncbi:MAG: nuclear transport factor 2 family protein [Kordia sp.]|nr:nuclear transport factor 2 family protein [Kordia sp.]